MYICVKNCGNSSAIIKPITLTPDLSIMQLSIGKVLENTMLAPNQQSCQYTDSFKMEQNLALLLIVIPLEQQGALETVLLEAISEDAYDRNIVERCRRFVDEIRPEADRYISSDRLQLKADLSVTWAVQSPQKVFDFIDKQIRSVHWESSRTLRECFCELEKI